MERKYYLIKIFYQSQNLFLIWYADDEDGFVMSENRILVFKNIYDAFSFSGDIGIALEQVVANFDIINIADLTKKIKNTMSPENCRELLDMWNLFGDMALCLKTFFVGNSDDELIRDVYEKLFYGSNIKVIMKNMGEYHPTLNQKESDILVSVFNDGLNILEQNVCKSD